MVGEEDAAQIQLPSISAKKPALVAERRSTKGSLTLFRGKIPVACCIGTKSRDNEGSLLLELLVICETV